MAYAGLQEVILHGPFHQVAVDGRLGDLLVVLNPFIVVALEGGEVGDFEVELI
jgi:hypothetical protein